MVQKIVRLKHSGFTLIELMAVITIIGILGAIAIPNFVSYRDKSFRGEAEVLLGAIASSQMQHKFREGVFVSCPPNPPDGKGPWRADMPEWNRIGIRIGGEYFQYEVVADASGFIAYARGKINTPVAHKVCEISSSDLSPKFTNW